jgi:hypothetical protein
LSSSTATGRRIAWLVIVSEDERYHPSFVALALRMQREGRGTHELEG